MAYDTAIAIGMTGIVALFYYLAASMKSDKHGALQIMFIFMGEFFTLYLIDILEKMADAAAATEIQEVLGFMYGSFIWVMVISMMYFIVMFIMDVYKVHIENIRKAERGGMK